MKRCFAAVLLLVLLLGLFSGCDFAGEREIETRLITDSCGREVEIPVEIERIAPSGGYAQIVLYTICPEKLCGISSALSRTQQKYMDQLPEDLPVLGHFYGTANTISYEALLAAEPDIIIDVGDYKENIAEDLDTLQRETGIPVVFVEAPLDKMAEAYDLLGDILGERERTDELAAYVRQVMGFAAAGRAQITDETRRTAVYVQGEYGLQVHGAGSTHAQVLDVVGVENAAVLGTITGGGGDEVTMDQMLLWDPEVVLISPDGNYDEIFDDPLWQGVTALQTGEVYEVPRGPYNWLDQPPSVQRVLGILWVGKLIYPDWYDFDMTEKTQEFYRLFWQYDLTREEAEDLLANSVK